MPKHIGITGTKGKSTTMYLIDHCLLEHGNSNVIKVSSTEGMFYNNNFLKSVFAHNYFDTEDIKYDYFLSEATSFMLQEKFYDYRIQDVVLYTGIEKNEHSEIHPTFNDYLKAKKRLFDVGKVNGFGIVNCDDEYYNIILNDYYGRVIRVGKNEGNNPDCLVQVVDISRLNMILHLNYKNNEYIIKTKLLGDFNAMNIAMAFVTVVELGIKPENAVKYIESFKGVEGRFQRIAITETSEVIIDYAHTDGSLEKLLKLVKDLFPEKEIITLFGCGGNKSLEKRPLMGKYAGIYSDYVYITDDNPRTENRLKIAKEIENGIKPVSDKYEIELDRHRAIAKAIKYAYENENVLVIMAGKGSEKIYLVDGKRIPRSDYSMTMDILDELNADRLQQ